MLHVTIMMKIALVPTVLLIGLILLVPLSISASGASAMEDTRDITYSVGANGVEIHSANTTVLISNSLPAASARAGNLTNLTGDGFVLRSFVGYNASSGGGFSPDLMEFIAPTNRSTWIITGPQKSENSQGAVVSLEMNTILDIIQLGGPGSGPGGPGSGGPVSVIQDWAEVTIRFTVSTYNYSSTYQGLSQSPTYSVNGSSELKFDVSVVILKPLPVDRLALEVALMKMDDSLYTSSTSSGPYGFRGYQGGDKITESDPSVNETQGSTLVTHSFENRDQLKQAFDFVNETGIPDGFLSWASQAKAGTTGGAGLTNVSAFYRTDGEALTIYLSTPLTTDTITIDHDPSVGVFSGISYPIVLPGNPTLGSSLLMIVVGVAVGVGVVGGTGAYVLSRGEDQDPAYPVDLEKNRYYRGLR